MARLSRFVTVVALLGGATVFLSACTGGTDPVASPSPTVTVVVTASPSASPSPTPLSDEELLALIPESARAENFGGAVNFAKFFILEYQRMFDEKDGELFAFLSGPECEFCSSSVSEFKRLIGAGGRREGGEVLISDDPAQGELRNDGFWYVGFLLSVSENHDFDADGVLVENLAGGAGDVALKLDWQGDHWQVVGVNVNLP